MHFLLTTSPTLLLSSKFWSTICYLIADSRASMRHLISQPRQTRLCPFELHLKQGVLSACKTSFWMTEGFLTSLMITTMCFIQSSDASTCWLVSLQPQPPEKGYIAWPENFGLCSTAKAFFVPVMYYKCIINTGNARPYSCDDNLVRWAPNSQ